MKGGIWASCKWIHIKVLILSPPLIISSVWVKATTVCEMSLGIKQTQNKGCRKFPIAGGWWVWLVLMGTASYWKKPQCNLRRETTCGAAVYLAMRANHQRPQLQARLVWAYLCHMKISKNNPAWIYLTYMLIHYWVHI